MSDSSPFAQLRLSSLSSHVSHLCVLVFACETQRENVNIWYGSHKRIYCKMLQNTLTHLNKPFTPSKKEPQTHSKSLSCVYIFHILMPWVCITSGFLHACGMWLHAAVKMELNCDLFRENVSLQSVLQLFNILLSSHLSSHICPDHLFRCHGPSASPTASTRRCSRWCCPSCHTSPSVTWRSQRKLAAST